MLNYYLIIGLSIAGAAIFVLVAIARRRKAALLKKKEDEGKVDNVINDGGKVEMKNNVLENQYAAEA